MKKRLQSKAALLGAVVAAGIITSAPPAAAEPGGKAHMYEVTITNATRGQPVAPSVIATHNNAFRLFELGPAPLPGDSGYDDYFALAAMAETGYPFHVLDQVSATDGVWEAVPLPVAGRTPPVLLPGESNSVMISASGKARYLSAVAMLGRTNDAVYALRGVPLPKHIGQKVDFLANAYDVGSESNDESAATVGALGSTEDDGASGTGINTNGEGYIHVHAGIHGVGGPDGLSPAADDWRDPVVQVRIERIQ